VTATMPETVWDGVDTSYIPDADLRIDPGLALHQDSEPVDEFLFEVLRHNLWNVNDEHGSTILKVSGSPIASTAEDFQTAILTEDAEFVFFGPRIQTQSGTMDLAIKWILENRSSNPGIHEGDIFLCNDPWVGSTHQQDVGLYAPVFHEGRLFCWVGNALHQYDIGGSTPGGFCPDATDTFVEPVSIPPIKIVEAGQRRRDIEEFYLRHSRMPDLVALDLRAQIAGNTVARNRIKALLERYGALTVKGVMRKIIDDGERTFVRRLERLQDGVWRSRSYLEVALDQDRGLYPVALQIEKRGDELIFGMEGTAEQAGALNIGFATWRSGILTAVNPMMCHDLLYATGGPLRHMRFEPIPGTVLCANRPASTSNAQIGVLITGGLATSALGRLLATDEELAHELFAPGATTQFPIDSLSGIDQWGKPYGTILLDAMLGGTGAFTFRDGVDTGGCWWDPRSLAPNVEENEHYFPILYLYRREWQNSGGAGRWRGGNSAVMAFVAHGTDLINHSTASSGVAVPTSEGLFGGLPASPCRYRFRRNSGTRASLAHQRMPADYDELSGTEEILGPKQRGIVQRLDDVMEIAWCAGGGIGDPILREPEAVLADVKADSVSERLARDVYGVVVAGDTVDDAATARRRDDIRRERGHTDGNGPRPAPDAADGPTVARVADVLVIRSDNAGGRVIACGACGHELAGPGQSYKDHANRRESPINESVAHQPDPHHWIDDDLVLREFSCPGCSTLLCTEVARTSDPPLVDIELVDP
jgi:N-methylhydantoinase B